MSRVYGARTLKRARRTKAAVEQLDEQMLNVLRADHPQSVRHVFYRMTDPKIARARREVRAGISYCPEPMRVASPIRAIAVQLDH